MSKWCRWLCLKPNNHSFQQILKITTRVGNLHVRTSIGEFYYAPGQTELSMYVTGWSPLQFETLLCAGNCRAVGCLTHPALEWHPIPVHCCCLPSVSTVLSSHSPCYHITGHSLRDRRSLFVPLKSPLELAVLPKTPLELFRV